MPSVAQLIATVGPALILLIVLSDAFCLATARPTPGQVIQWWARDHPVIASLFGGFVGAFAAHIFWHT